MIKPIKFVYYRMFSNDDIQPYSIVEIIDAINQMTLMERIRIIDHDRYRLENIYAERINDTDFIHLRFMRLDFANIPNISYDNRESVPLPLDEGQYLGTPLHVLYDVSHQIYMVQQNRTTMSVGKLSQYINIIAHDIGLLNGNTLIELRPIISRNRLRDGAIFSKIELRFANIAEARIDDRTDLFRIVNLYNNYNALTGSIVLGLGHSRNNQLNNQNVRRLCNEIVEYRENITSAKVFYHTDEYQGFINLIKDVINDELRFELEPRQCLTREYAQTEMLQKFIERLPVLLQELGEQ